VGEGMFTGILEAGGRGSQQRRSPAGAALRVGTGLPVEEIRAGDSIAVNGVCLTVTGIETGWFEADVSHETLAATTLGALRQGDAVHLERALALGGRLGGHLVFGHVDGVGELVSRRSRGANLDLEILAPGTVAPFLVAKGSVAVDGVSLTVNDPAGARFRTTLVPHTLAGTVLGERRPGDRLNLEGDILGKYVKHFVDGMRGSGLDERFLVEHGFGQGD